MRFMMLIKSDANTEAGVLPDEKLLTAMGKYNEELVNAGAMLAGEGLHPSSKGARLRNVGGKLTLIDGPFAESKELIAGFWLIQADSMEQAIEWAKRVPFEADEAWVASGEVGEIEIRQVSEFSDFPPEYLDADAADQGAEETAGDQGTTAPVPDPSEAGKLQFMMMFKADKSTEAGILPDKKTFAEMGNAVGEMVAKGVLVSGEGLRPSSQGAKVLFSRGTRTVIDGPFTESKELICSYVIVRAHSKAEAIEWAKKGLLIHGDGESEIRQVFQASDFGDAFTPELQEAEERMRQQVEEYSKQSENR